MRKLITIVCMLVMSIQLLPIVEMGRCLANNQFVEEETVKKGSEVSPEFIKDVTFPDLSPQFFFIDNATLICSKTDLHKPPVTNILTPPPNA